MVVWVAWQELRLAHPTPDQSYLMQIACEVRRVLNKDPANIKLNDFKLSWSGKTADQQLTDDQVSEIMMKRHMRMGGGKKPVIVPREEWPDNG